MQRTKSYHTTQSNRAYINTHDARLIASCLLNLADKSKKKFKKLNFIDKAKQGVKGAKFKNGVEFCKIYTPLQRKTHGILHCGFAARSYRAAIYCQMSHPS